MNENKYELSIEERKEIYEKFVKPFIFSKIHGDESVNSNNTKPKVIIVGGQPGAGKTEILMKSYKDLNYNAAIIDGDMLRQFHPYGQEVYEKYGREGSQYTHTDCAKWSIWAMREVRESGYNVVLENTLRNDSICETIEIFKEKGYDVIVRALAVNKIDSKLGIFKRYEDQLNLYNSDVKNIIPRFTPLKWHDDAYYGIVDTLRAIEKNNNCNIEIYKRGAKLIYNSSANIPNFKGIHAAEMLCETREEGIDIDRLKFCADQVSEMLITSEMVNTRDEDYRIDLKRFQEELEVAILELDSEEEKIV